MTSPAAFALFVFSLLNLVTTTAAQNPLYMLWSPSNLRGWGNTVYSLGDLDGDGAQEFFVGNGVSAGAVHTGRTGAALWTLQGAIGAVSPGDLDGDGRSDLVVATNEPRLRAYAWPGRKLLWSVQEPSKAILGDGRRGLGTCGDLNGDGVSDLVASGRTAAGRLKVWVVSGKNGAPIHRLDFGAKNVNPPVAGAGDWNGDRIPDFLVGYVPSGSPLVPGFSILFSGKTGKEIFRWRSRSVVHQVGSSIDAGQDLDGDGKPDAVFFEEYFRGSKLFVVGGATRKKLFELSLSAYSGSVAITPDYDRDGLPDIAVSEHRARRFRVVQGKAGKVLLDYTPPARFSNRPAWYGAGTAAVGDVDKDGTPDFLLGAPGREQRGAADVLSGNPRLGLRASPATISAAAGGRQTMQIDVGAGRAGHTYVFLGSLQSGKGPGIIFPPIWLDLTFDGYLSHTLTFPGQAPLVGGLGKLDAKGRASAAFALPGGFGFLAGLTIHHVAVVVTDKAALYASNPVSVRIVP